MESIKCGDCGLPYTPEPQYCERSACQFIPALLRSRIRADSRTRNEILTVRGNDDIEQQIPCTCEGAVCCCAIDTVLGEFDADAPVDAPLDAPADIIATEIIDSIDIIDATEIIDTTTATSATTTATSTTPIDITLTREYIRTDMYESFNDAYNKFNRVYGFALAPYELTHAVAKRVYIALVCVVFISHFVGVVV